MVAVGDAVDVIELDGVTLALAEYVLLTLALAVVD